MTHIRPDDLQVSHHVWMCDIRPDNLDPDRENGSDQHLRARLGVGIRKVGEQARADYGAASG